jgi:hypothetical protein
MVVSGIDSFDIGEDRRVVGLQRIYLVMAQHGHAVLSKPPSWRKLVAKTAVNVTAERQFQFERAAAISA